MMPKDVNAYGSIFGGIILSYIDQAGIHLGIIIIKQEKNCITYFELVFRLCFFH